MLYEPGGAQRVRKPFDARLDAGRGRTEAEVGRSIDDGQGAGHRCKGYRPQTLSCVDPCTNQTASLFDLTFLGFYVKRVSVWSATSRL